MGTISGSSARAVETPIEDTWTTVEDVFCAAQRQGDPEQRVEAA